MASAYKAKTVSGRTPVAVELTDGVVFEFRDGLLYIWDSEDDMTQAKDCLNVYELETMYRMPQE